MMIAAAGVLSAIGQAFGGKQSHAMAGFRRGLGGGAGGGDSGDMATLRKRIRQLVAS